MTSEALEDISIEELGKLFIEYIHVQWPKLTAERILEIKPILFERDRLASSREERLTEKAKYDKAIRIFSIVHMRELKENPL